MGAAILAVQRASPRLIATVNERYFADLQCGDYFSQRASTLLSLASIITQGTSNDLLMIETRNALDSGLNETDIMELLKLLRRVAGGAAISQAEAAVAAALSERSNEMSLTQNQAAA
jgi:alkylhydroperoxidase/carboxymuconolactone decarboxylase family protein YurZ